MTTGHLDDDEDDPQHRLPPPASRVTMIVDSESKRKEDADTHHLRPSFPPPAIVDYEEKEPSLSPSSAASFPSSPPSPSSPAWDFPSPPPFRPFFLHQWLDVCDTEGVWLESQIIAAAPTTIQVHYKGYKAKYDEWIHSSPHHPHADRLAPLHTHTRPRFPLPTRPLQPIPTLLSSLPYPIDCLDTTDQWLPARIVQCDVSTCLLLIAYDGWSSQYNEWINIDSYRIARRGLHSQPTVVVNRVQWEDGVESSGPVHSVAAAASGRRKSEFTPTSDNESKFRRALLTQLRYSIVEQKEDGNCLFRAVSHQLYDNSEWHMLVRDKCMTYIAQEHRYFRSFVVGDWDAYLHRMRQPGEWGDHVEIQALSEIYDMPIEIYAYSTHPLRTYRGEGGEGRGVMRLSYHFASHYNSVVPLGRTHGQLPNLPPGLLEDELIERRRLHREAATALASSPALGHPPHGLSASRSEFTAAPSLSDFDRAVAESMRSMCEEEERKVEEVKRESEREDIERKAMELVLQQSADDHQQHQLATASQHAADHDMQLAMQLSAQAQYPSAVQKLMDLGFTADQCCAAYSVFEGEGLSEEVMVQNMMEWCLAQRAGWE